MRGLLAGVLAGLVLLSGCASKEASDTDVPPVDPATGEPAANATDFGALPAWRYQQAWKHHWSIGQGGSIEFDTWVTVTNVTATGYELASDTREVALFHATFFFPTLGFMRSDLSANEQGTFSYPWYSFPLADGKTWTGTEANLDFSLAPVSRTLTMTASRMGGTPGEPEHFMVEARDEGGLRAWYDYDPNVGWFTEFRTYDGGEDRENWTMRAELTETADPWSGTWYRAEGKLLLQDTSLLVPTAAVADPMQPQPFVVSAQATDVQVLMFAFAESGAADVSVVAPDATAYHAYSSPVPLAPTVPNSFLIQVPAQDGSWHAAATGASPIVAGTAIFAWEATVQQGNV